MRSVVSIGISGAAWVPTPALQPHGKWSSKRSFSRTVMPANPDFKDLFSILNEERVEYLVVGAHAVIHYTEPRYTKDLDLWINPTPDNAERAMFALRRFGAPLANIVPADFQNPELVYQIGVAPNRIDVLMGIAGVDFPSAWAQRVTTTYDGIPIHVLSLAILRKAKLASGRPQDLLDLKRLDEDHPPADLT